ncbi:class I poly(R)-hydroxyalkanoic acid synthase [Wenxinia marina]|uniref:Poly(R)-hydroxyalkanoic acid synthase, class I n=1 Tax=Wenxinia marina DSM 24838 TaxID=1123501 RepID=A0A0D0Q2V0_9RHOB|nr:class I poly(R)-hydroxyalkanoic acid synthase [Wenxinia marina]KIQ68874.1 poly(R)-hydroxyalkanoic acid synthase, class I [Wenxinia marina DSM 24838]GGL64503.1 class I poly(R)-hydroxyalkanoic acid synthase [Wenxinia marina]
MATKETPTPPGTPPDAAETLAKFEENLGRVEALTERLLKVMGGKRQVRPDLQAPGQDLYLRAAHAYWTDMMQNPAKLIEQQVGYWGETLKTYAEATQELMHGHFHAPADPGPSDRRFSNPLWDSHPWFNYVKQQYLANAKAIETAVEGVEGLDAREKQRLTYFSKQIVDMMAPTNFLATNPDALERAVETEGQSLVDGLENLIADLEANEGELVVTLADRKAFEIGENIATAPGEVVWRNHLFELIQYSPTTEKVHQTPVVLFPPWINKFYILDLKPANSLIRWIVDQGYTLFVVSWVNPDASYRDTGMVDYVEDGFLTAIREAKAICGTKSVNAIGYCIAGTTLSLTLALMKKRGDTSVKSATFFTTLTDFSDQGEVGVFLDDDFVDGIEAEVTEKGYLDKFFMARTFSYLRSNDLIYQPAIRSYMMGQTPPAFDLLFWNGDGTNLPAKMAVEYLRGLCQRDDFATRGFRLGDETVHISDVSVPVCAIACETDHIAAWKSSYRGLQGMGSKDKTFLLAGSGHIAGIVNPPAKKKYAHWTNDDLSLDPEAWKAAAERHEGSWWAKWEAWLAKRSGKMVPARTPGDESHPPLAPAPGTYVRSVSRA